MGSPDEVIAPFKYLLDHAGASALEVVAVVSQPARPVGRGGMMSDPALAAYAKERGVLCLQPESAKSQDFLSELRALSPDVIVTAAYGQILSEEFLGIPSIATINIHPSELPKYRGATPVPAALLDGLSATAVTILFTVKKLDAGNIITQKSFDIASDETGGQLTRRLFEASGPLLLDAIHTITTNPNFLGEPQHEAEATFCKKIDKDMGQVDWNLPAQDIVNRFRAFEPWPGTWSTFQGRRVAITSLGPIANGPPLGAGQAVFDKSGKVLRVGCGDGQVGIRRMKPAGGKDMDAASFWNGIKDKSRDLYFEETRS